MRKHATVGRKGATGLALILGLSLSACVGGVSHNRSMDSVHQPIVEKSDYVLDLNTSGSDGLAYGERERLAGWFGAMGMKYGDRIAIDDPAAGPATRETVEAVASRYGLVVDDHTPPTAGAVAPGTVRIVMSRARAFVPGCPDWSSNSDGNPNNGLSSNFGCAVNTNLAAMVANPNDLLHGEQDTGTTTTMTSNRAISAYRAATPTGRGGVAVNQVNSKEN